MFRRASKKYSSTSPAFANPNWDESGFLGLDDPEAGYADLEDVNEMTPMMQQLPTYNAPYQPLYSEVTTGSAPGAPPATSNIIITSSSSDMATDDSPLWAQPRQGTQYTDQQLTDLREQLDKANQHAELVRQENIRLQAQVRDFRETVIHLQQQLQRQGTRTTPREQEALSRVTAETNRADQLQRTLDSMAGGTTALQHQQEIDQLTSMFSEADSRASEQARHIKDLEDIIQSQTQELATLHQIIAQSGRIPVLPNYATVTSNINTST